LRRLVFAGAIAGVVFGATAVALGFVAHRGQSQSLPGAGLATGIPQPVKPAFTVPTPRPLVTGAAHALWAPVTRSVLARRAPSLDAPAIARLELRTPEGTSNLVLLAGASDPSGRRWVRVRLPILPNNTTGWVPRSALGGLVPVDTHLVADLERLKVDLLRRGHRIFEAPIGVGASEAPTPRGEFYVRDKLTSFDNSFYGPIAFGTSARSAVLTDWPDGGYIGIHGTNEPQLIPGRISHGCIRMRNDDIVRLARLMPIGTPLTIR
jgi:lipoprotein-anchoring transpeptidase ErfK/SrfK